MLFQYRVLHSKRVGRQGICYAKDGTWGRGKPDTVGAGHGVERRRQIGTLYAESVPVGTPHAIITVPDIA
eukprot:1729046-Rhodomonas_salina.1